MLDPREGEIRVMLGRRLENARVDAGVSRAGIAGIAGLATSTVQCYEAGSTWPTLWYILNVSKYTKVPMNKILEGFDL